MRLGNFYVETGDVIKNDISWDNSGTILVMYTDREYSDDDILASLQGIPGRPKTAKGLSETVSGGINKNEPQGNRRMFNFTSTASSSLVNEQTITAPSGAYPFYIIHGGFTVMAPLRDGIDRVDANGNVHEIWSYGPQ